MAQVSPSWTWRQPRYNTGIRGLRNPIFFFSGSLCSTSFRESILRANNVAGREGPEPSQHWVSSKKHEPYEAPCFFFTYISPDRNQLRASVMPTLSNSISRKEQKWGKGWIGSWIRPFAPSFPLLIRSLESGTRGCRAPEPPISGIAVMRPPLPLYIRKDGECSVVPVIVYQPLSDQSLSLFGMLDFPDFVLAQGRESLRCSIFNPGLLELCMEPSV